MHIAIYKALGNEMSIIEHMPRVRHFRPSGLVSQPSWEGFISFSFQEPREVPACGHTANQWPSQDFNTDPPISRAHGFKIPCSVSTCY